MLVVAPAEQRAARLAKREGLSSSEAHRRLAREDEQRREFLAQFGVNPDDPALYDLVVNTETLGPDAAVTLVMAALQARG